MSSDRYSHLDKGLVFYLIFFADFPGPNQFLTGVWIQWAYNTLCLEGIVVIVSDSSNAQRRQVSGPRLHSSKINSWLAWRTLKGTTHFPLYFVGYHHGRKHILSQYIDKTVGSDVSKEHSMWSESTSVWADLFNVYSCPVLFVPLVVYGRKRTFEEGKAPWVCKAGGWGASDVIAGFWRCRLPAVASPASYLNSLSLSIFACKVAKWAFRDPSCLSIYYTIPWC